MSLEYEFYFDFDFDCDNLSSQTNSNIWLTYSEHKKCLVGLTMTIDNESNESVWDEGSTVQIRK